MRPVRHAGTFSEKKAGKDFREQPERQQPVRFGLESNSFSQRQIGDTPQGKNYGHFDFSVRKAHQKCAHQRGHRARRSHRRNDAARIGPGMKLQRGDASDQIERRIDQPPPGVLQNGSGQPQKPHVADQVQPSEVQKVCGQISQRPRMRWNECVLIGKRFNGWRGVLLDERIHLRLQRSLLIEQAHTCVPAVGNLAVGS